MNLSPEGHDQIVTSEVAKLIGDSLCVICQTGFLSQEERDAAVFAGKDGGQTLFAHGVCWDEERKRTERTEDLHTAFSRDLRRIADEFAREIDRYARRNNEPT